MDEKTILDQILDHSPEALTVIDKSVGIISKGLTIFNKAKKNKSHPPSEEDILEAKEMLLAFKEAILEFRQMTFDQKNQIHCLTEEKSALEKKLSNIKKASIVKICDGSFAYVFDDSAETLNNGPWYCQTCLDDGKKSIFQRTKPDHAFDNFECPQCNTVIKKQVQRAGPGWGGGGILGKMDGY